jgi:cell wall-associated NlpC family hydrolase
VIRRLPGSNWLAVVALVLAAGSGACASTGAVPKPFPVPSGSSAPPASGSPASPAPPAPSAAAPSRARSGIDGYALAGTALSLRGAPYRNGGTDPTGFDCSGFTQYVFAQHGVALPREVREQYRVGKSIKQPGDLAPGDILFFATTESGPSHVAIAIGGDEFVHAPSSTGVVRVEHLSSSYWSPRYLGARRLN